MDLRSIVRALSRCRSVLLRTVLPMVLVASRHSARGSGGKGANQKNVPLDRVPLAGSLSLKGRQPEFYKYQSGRRRTANSEASPNQATTAQPFTPPPRWTPKGRPRERSPEPLVLARFWLLLPRGKSNRRVRGRAGPGLSKRTERRRPAGPQNPHSSISLNVVPPSSTLVLTYP